ncbi:TPA: hypothetical protein HHT47_002046 [Escherichia coli]|nr:hypothetical protein [Escherichia coli]
MSRKQLALFEPTLVVQALKEAVKKLNPQAQWRNPVMFIVWIGSLLTTCISIAMASGAMPGNALNIMRLHSPDSAILSAVIFNALIIVFLIPLALKGVSYKPLTASAMLRRNLWIYGLGGLLVPFIGIKVIDLLLTVCGLV